MRRLFPAVLLLLTIFCGCTRHDKNTAVKKRIADRYVDIEIPSDWIDKLRAFKYDRNTKDLIGEFEGFLKPDSLINPHAEHIAEGYGRVLDPLFVDLDGEPGEEMICLLAWDVSSPYLCVFKQYDGNWHLIYLEAIDTLRGTSSLNVANCFSKNKVFYCRYVTNYGSGVYQDNYCFYKLINNKVYKCLDLINESNYVGYKTIMNQDVKLSFEFNGDDSDGIWVGYTYNFSSALSDYNDEDISLIKGSSFGGYKWNDNGKIYELVTDSNQTPPQDLTAKKIACFDGCARPDKLISAFHDEIKLVLKEGSPLQKRSMVKYLKAVEDEKTAK